MASKCPDSQPKTSPCSVDLYIECTGLRDSDVLSRSDPCVVLSMTHRKGQMMEIGRTETIDNNLNPKFARPIRVDYNFEEEQPVVIDVYDVDNPERIIADNDLLGTLQVTLGQIMANNPFGSPLRMKDKRKEKGHITIRACRCDEDGDTVELTFQARNLDKKDVLSKSDPFLEIQKQTLDGHWLLVHRTEVIKNTSDPMWRSFTLSNQTLCDRDKHRRIKIDCYDYDRDGRHDFIGGFSTTLEDIMKPSSSKAGFACINPKKVNRKRYTNSGIVYVSYQIQQSEKERTFLNFVFGGLKMNFIIGIDFTHSNGDPRHYSSLHHISLSTHNEYMVAIRAVGDICQHYDSDRLFPAFGFGAKIPPSNTLSHDFPINFNNENPNCKGIDGVLGAYTTCLQKVELFGPTIVAPVIHRAVRFALEGQAQEPLKGPHAYYVLLILTEGIFNDMPDAKRAIIEASGLPLSLIIIGVGVGDFREMDGLCGRSKLLSLSTGEVARRDIVQFVCFRDFKQHSTDTLASNVLAKIPAQVTEYFRLRGLNPKIPQCLV